MVKNASAGPPEAAPEPDRTKRALTQVAALVVHAFALFILLSLASLQIHMDPGLCGPVGRAAARALWATCGLPSYLLPLLFFRAGSALWRVEPIGTSARVLCGLALLMAVADLAIGLAAGSEFYAGSLGLRAAGLLNRYLSLGGGYLVIALLVAGISTLLSGRPPEEIIRGLLRLIGRTYRPFEPEASSPVIELGAAHVIREHEHAPFPNTSVCPPAGSTRSASPPTLSRVRFEPVQAGDSEASRGAGKKARFKLPPLSLLDSPPAGQLKVDREGLARSAKVLEEKLADFGVTGRVVEVQRGPVISLYKLEPASGIKVSQILNLADDLSLALKAPSVRIQAPVPGEAVVGIEVPNRRREQVYLREILESPEFAGAPEGQLSIALGKDIAGRPMVADLAGMPHLLIAGATGTGKSVALHSMIASILFSATAEDVRLILIDPKVLELSVYDNIPHLLVPPVIDPEKAGAALFWATQEMERRYRLMHDLGVRNIDSYNAALAEGKTTGRRDAASLGRSDLENEALEHGHLFKIVIVIDELADLMLTVGKNIERDITRLAQKARAAGIHLLLATQRPSVDVITGLIKANLPARISFQVASRVDSRTILDSIGAERLLGNGDMLFMPPGTARLIRLHGPFVSEAEIHRITEFLRKQGAPDYQMDILEAARNDAAAADNSTEKDEMYDEAVRLVTETNQASISMIQRRLRIGYNRAARIVEQMEREGIVSQADGIRPREVRPTLRVVR